MPPKGPPKEDVWFRTGNVLDNGTYRLVTQVGGTETSVVIKAEDLKSSLENSKSKKFVALKTPFSEKNVSWKNEEAILTKLKEADKAKREQYIVHFLKKFEAKELHFLVFEFLPMSILQFMSSINQGIPLPRPHVQKIAKQLFEALDFIHGQGCFHADLTTAKFMLVEVDTIDVINLYGQIERRLRNPIIRLIDFANASDKTCKHGITTLVSCAPEVALGLECSVKCDMFSAACALMEMWLFRAPFLSGPKPSVRSHLAIMQKVLGQLPEYLMKNAYKAQKGEPGLVNKPEANSSNNEQSPRYTLDWPTSKTLQQMKDHVENVPTLNAILDTYKGGPGDVELGELIRKLLTIDPGNRLSAAGALRHPYLKANIPGDSAVVIGAGTKLGDYTLGELLGSGIIGKTFKAEKREASRAGSSKSAVVAIKVSMNVVDTNVHVEKIITELKIANARDCQTYVVNLIHRLQINNRLVLAFEHLDMTLDHFVTRINKSRPLPRHHVQELARQLLKALSFLHHHIPGKKVPCIHANLNPDNIMLVNAETDKIEHNGGSSEYLLRDRTIRLIGFDLATYSPNTINHQFTSIHYRAPEDSLGLSWTERIDLFALGCILWFLSQGETLLDTGLKGGKNNINHLAKMQKVLGPLPQNQLMLSYTYTENRPELKQLVKAITNKSKKKNNVMYELDFKRSETPSEVLDNLGGTKPLRNVYKMMKGPRDSELGTLVQELLSPDPEARPSADEALGRPYFAANIPA